MERYMINVSMSTSKPNTCLRVVQTSSPFHSFSRSLYFYVYSPVALWVIKPCIYMQIDDHGPYVNNHVPLCYFTIIVNVNFDVVEGGGIDPLLVLAR